ncbi:hypothetical protein [uncultured Ruminococcus sp.]|uniref:hypothetical protein n=1 Tax=uncultured Ruminococcus sp. TaxID=165186 RepID=UPI00292F7590|nr:hypothetical protein [uncultured Ruminococcus sp.]
MRKLLSLVLALVMICSVTAIAASAANTDAAATAAETATVTLYDMYGEVATTGTYNVGDTITCTMYLNTSLIGTIGSIKANQTYTSANLTLADKYSEKDGLISDMDTMFPVTKKQTVANGKLDGKVAYNASTPLMGEDGFHFDTDESALIVTHYTVTAAGEAEIHNEINTLAVADYHLTRVIVKNIVLDDRFTTAYSLSESTAATGVTVSGNITSFLKDDDVTVTLTGVDNNFTTNTIGINDYNLVNVPAGSYTLTISKKNHVTRDYEITVADADVTQDVKIHPLGDVTGDGKISTADYGKANSHARNKTLLQGYELKCADVIGGDGKVGTADAGRINSAAKGKMSLWT